MASQSEIELVEELKASETPEPHHFDLSIIQGSLTKTASLLGNTDSNNALRSENRWFTYKFEKPIFVEEIRVKTEHFGFTTSFEFSYLTFPDNNSFSENARMNENEYKLLIGNFVSKISFRPPRQYISGKMITGVEVLGLTTSEVSAHLKIASNLKSLKNKLVLETQKRLDDLDAKEERLVDYEASVEEYTETVEGLKAKESAIQSAISKLESKRDEVSERIRLLSTSESEFKSRIDGFEDSIDQKKKEQKALNSEIGSLHSELQGLKSDINMFPSEISGYNSEAGKQVRLYAGLAIIPLILFGVVTAVLFSRAADLTYIFAKNENVDVFSIFVTRLPFVTVSAAILAVSYKVAKQLILEVIEINRKRQKLTQVSIVASDVTTAAADGLSLSDELKFENRISLRMSLLKDVLTGLISEGYKYSVKTAQNGDDEEFDKNEEQNDKLPTDDDEFDVEE